MLRIRCNSINSHNKENWHEDDIEYRSQREKGFPSHLFKAKYISVNRKQFQKNKYQG